MKKILALAFAALCLTFPMRKVQAGQYHLETLSTGTNVIAASGTLSPTAAILDLAKQDYAALQMTFALSGTGVAAVNALVYKSLDGTTYETVASGTLSVTASGTNTVCGVLNLGHLGGVRYLKIGAITSANTPSTVAGLVLKAGVKPDLP